MADWYYMSGEQQQGPVTGTQLKALAADGVLAQDDHVWNESLTEWTPAKRVRGLFPATPASSPRQPIQPAAQRTPTAAAKRASARTAPAQAAIMQAVAEPPPSQTPPPIPAGFPAGFPPASSNGNPAVLGYSAPDVAGGISPGVAELLRKTMPWVRLLSIALFAYAGLMLLGFLNGFIRNLIAAIRSGGSPHMGPGDISLFVYIRYLFAVPFFLLPAWFLHQYASRIKQMLATGRTHDLERALSAQKSYWVYAGILVTIVLALFALSFVMEVLGNL